MTGLALVALGVVMPRILTVEQMRIPSNLIQAIRTQDAVYILLAALKLVGLNTIRGLPHYLGAFIMADSLVLTWNERPMKLAKAAMVCLVIPQVYHLIDHFFGIHYDFGVPAVVLILLLLLLGKADYNLVSLPKKLMMVSVFITSVQFLDIMPSLSSFPVGRGETSKEIKHTAAFLGAENVLQSMALLFFILLLLVGVLLYMLVRDENNLRAMNELKKQNERMLMETRLRVLENRTYMEMKHLVHDLKSPLTSAQALVSLVKLSSEQRQDTLETIYLDKIETSIERMSGMISELLNENHWTDLSTKELLSAVLAQISVSEYATMVQVQNDVPEGRVCVNKIRFVRALVNLIENAFYAVDNEKGEIHLSVQCAEEQQGKKIFFTVQDNGRGIAPDLLDVVWDGGFSTRSSHGLGLSFVKKVVTNSGGTIQIESRVGMGTTVTIALPEGEATDE